MSRQSIMNYREEAIKVKSKLRYNWIGKKAEDPLLFGIFPEPDYSLRVNIFDAVVRMLLPIKFR